MKSFRYWMAVVTCSLVMTSSAPNLSWAEPGDEPAAPATEAAPAEQADAAAADAPVADAPAVDETTPQPAEPVESEEPAAAPAASEQPAADEPEMPAAAEAEAEVPVVEAAPPTAAQPQAADEGAAAPAAGATGEAGDEFRDPADVMEGAAEEAEAVAQGAQAAADDQGLSPIVLFLIVIVALALPYWLGTVIANSLRMEDYGWKIGLGLVAITSASIICYFGWPPRLGPDLSGGINLIYEIEPGEKDVETEKLIGALSRRINPGGLKEVMIRPYGNRQVEIIIPKADDAEIERVERSIITAGALEFRIVANRQDHAPIIEAALATEEDEVIISGTPVARWVKLDTNQFDPLRTTDFITRQNLRGEPEVLVIMDVYDVTGEFLENASTGMDTRGRPAVNFTFNAQGTRRFDGLTTENAPNPGTGFKRSLGIVLDNTLLSAPVLNEPIIGGSGQISGDSFTTEEVDFLVSILNAGSLPAALNKTPISKQVTSPTLGADTVQRGAWSMIASVIAVMVFMLIYYRLFAGTVACFALLFNMILLVAVMILLKAAFTLPGIAGLVLTIGMAIDANVLIYERIREELNRGAGLRMAIRNGFDRATTTIIDANLTTIITAVVLYWIGTDQIKGFAVTVILGIIMSMFTAIFLGRIAFEIAERKRWITSLNMMQLLGNTHFDFLGRRRMAIGAALALMAIGLVGIASRGANLLDIDFTGGSSVTVAFEEAQNISAIRQEVEQAASELEAEVEAAQERGDTTSLAEIVTPIDFTVVGVGEGDRLFRIDTSIRDFQIAQQMLKQQFGERLVTNSLQYSPPQTTGVSSSTTGAGHALDVSQTQPVALQDEEQGPAAEAPAEATPAEQPATQTQGAVRTTTTLTFGEPIKHDSLVQMLQDIFVQTELPEVPFQLTNVEHTPGSEVPLAQWELSISLPAEQTEQLLSALSTQVNSFTVFPSSSNIGGQVAQDTQAQAGYALFTSLLFIVAYVWLRFQRIMFGLAAVLALVHDVIITLGVLALSKVLVDFAPSVAAALLIDPFKISLSIVAAILTVVGYSINDTIVIFDRIREVRGKSPTITPQMINISINQTLSRTLLTSGTTLLVVLILYIWGGPGLHGFAFTLMVGIVAGTFSSVFIASPILLWMSQPAADKKNQIPTETVKA